MSEPTIKYYSVKLYEEQHKEMPKSDDKIQWRSIEDILNDIGKTHDYTAGLNELKQAGATNVSKNTLDGGAVCITFKFENINYEQVFNPASEDGEFGGDTTARARSHAPAPQEGGPERPPAPTIEDAYKASIAAGKLDDAIAQLDDLVKFLISEGRKDDAKTYLEALGITPTVTIGNGAHITFTFEYDGQEHVVSGSPKPPSTPPAPPADDEDQSEEVDDVAAAGVNGNGGNQQNTYTLEQIKALGLNGDIDDILCYYFKPIEDGNGNTVYVLKTTDKIKNLEELADALGVKSNSTNNTNNTNNTNATNGTNNTNVNNGNGGNQQNTYTLEQIKALGLNGDIDDILCYYFKPIEDGNGNTVYVLKTTDKIKNLEELADALGVKSNSTNNTNNTNNTNATNGTNNTNVNNGNGGNQQNTYTLEQIKALGLNGDIDDILCYYFKPIEDGNGNTVYVLKTTDKIKNLEELADALGVKSNNTNNTNVNNGNGGNQQNAYTLEQIEALGLKGDIDDILCYYFKPIEDGNGNTVYVLKATDKIKNLEELQFALSDKLSMEMKEKSFEDVKNIVLTKARAANDKFGLVDYLTWIFDKVKSSITAKQYVDTNDGKAKFEQYVEEELNKFYYNWQGKDDDNNDFKNIPEYTYYENVFIVVKDFAKDRGLESEANNIREKLLEYKEDCLKSITNKNDIDKLNEDIAEYLEAKLKDLYFENDADLDTWILKQTTFDRVESAVKGEGLAALWDSLSYSDAQEFVIEQIEESGTPVYKLSKEEAIKLFVLYYQSNDFFASVDDIEIWITQKAEAKVKEAVNSTSVNGAQLNYNELAKGSFTFGNVAEEILRRYKNDNVNYEGNKTKIDIIAEFVEFYKQVASGQRREQEPKFNSAKSLKDNFATENGINKIKAALAYVPEDADDAARYEAQKLTYLSEQSGTKIRDVLKLIYDRIGLNGDNADQVAQRYTESDIVQLVVGYYTHINKGEDGFADFFDDTTGVTKYINENKATIVEAVKDAGLGLEIEEIDITDEVIETVLKGLGIWDDNKNGDDSVASQFTAQDINNAFIKFFYDQSIGAPKVEPEEANVDDLSNVKFADWDALKDFIDNLTVSSFNPDGTIEGITTDESLVETTNFVVKYVLGINEFNGKASEYSPATLGEEVVNYLQTRSSQTNGKILSDYLLDYEKNDKNAVAMAKEACKDYADKDIIGMDAEAKNSLDSKLKTCIKGIMTEKYGTLTTNTVSYEDCLSNAIKWVNDQIKIANSVSIDDYIDLVVGRMSYELLTLTKDNVTLERTEEPKGGKDDDSKIPPLIAGSPAEQIINAIVPKKNGKINSYFLNGIVNAIEGNKGLKDIDDVKTAFRGYLDGFISIELTDYNGTLDVIIYDAFDEIANNRTLDEIKKDDKNLSKFFKSVLEKIEEKIRANEELNKAVSPSEDLQEILRSLITNKNGEINTGVAGTIADKLKENSSLKDDITAGSVELGALKDGFKDAIKQLITETIYNQYEDELNKIIDDAIEAALTALSISLTESDEGIEFANISSEKLRDFVQKVLEKVEASIKTNPNVDAENGINKEQAYTYATKIENNKASIASITASGVNVNDLSEDAVKDNLWAKLKGFFTNNGNIEEAESTIRSAFDVAWNFSEYKFSDYSGNVQEFVNNIIDEIVKLLKHVGIEPTDEIPDD